ncbi:MAG TPA: hypothetical protein VFQ53_37855 [Kofleriaceae bacterium]|nr:hypothetical protein [Kofleriaceae bacterium]
MVASPARDVNPRGDLGAANVIDRVVSVELELELARKLGITVELPEP